MADTVSAAYASIGPGQGSNSGLVRRFNDRVILMELRRKEQASKADLARLASLTNNAAGVIVQALERAGMVRSLGKKRSGGRGQPATMLALDPEGAYAIGVRIDRVALETVLVDFTGKPRARRLHTLDLPPPERTIEILANDIAHVADVVPAERRDRLVGIGVAAPYDLGAWLDKLSLSSESYRHWDGFDIAGAIRSVSGLEVVAENDGTAATVAELFYGHGRSHNDFLYVFVSAAIGGGVVVDGRYLRGPRGNAGDIGMMPVANSGLGSSPVSSHTWDLLLSRASVNSLVRHLRWRGIPVQGLADLGAAAASAPEALDEWLADAVEALTGAVLAAAALLDLPAVVIDGDLPVVIIEQLARRLEARMIEEAPEVRPPPAVLMGHFGEDAAAVGAATLPFHLNFSPDADILTGQHVTVRRERARSAGDTHSDPR
ncbi:MAG: ROK family protein [Ancalomicrobiaceae bacterium]|nr:ROK family protein [Ancalomicrobiaceae bacterium]